MNKLQKSLLINAVFSGVSGLILLLSHKSIGNIFALNNNRIFWIVGIGLLLFSMTILLEVWKQRRFAILWIIIQDYIWVISSIILLILHPFNISYTGNAIIAGVALVVLLMAINQSKTLVQNTFDNSK